MPSDVLSASDLGTFPVYKPPKSVPSPLNLEMPTVTSHSLTSPSSPNLNEAPLSPSSSWAVGRSHTLPRRQMRNTVALEADVELEQLEPTKLVRMRRWILSLAVVNFDLDVGPVVDVLYPTIKITNSEKENIAFSSFPDSSPFDAGAQIHSFRIRDPESLRNVSSYLDEGAKSRSSDGFLYGFSLFHQRRDETSKRGYLQRSVVILTYLPLPSLFIRAVSDLAALYFTQGVPCIETACHNIANWPDPLPGLSCELGFMGQVLVVELPPNPRHQQSTRITAAIDHDVPPLLASAPPFDPSEISPILLFGSVLPKMWSLWECLALCEPVLLFAPTPKQASLAVWWLQDFLKPLALATDFRPYFHIHDQDFDQLVNKNKPKAGLLLGVTNPFFEDLCKHWPHVLSIMPPKDSKNGSKALIGGASSKAPDFGHQFGPTAGFHSKHQRYISKDRQLLKTLETALNNGSFNVTADAVQQLRRHFSTRASEILVPLNRYFTSLIPAPPITPGSAAQSLRSNTLPTQATPVSLRSFIPSDFFASLKTYGSSLPFRSKSKQRDFYERWLKTPAFGVWLAEREAETKEALLRKVS